ncbi:MAG: hypothetical protein MRY78_03785 [Saprospiraceae bacterium]|nr:hypothetical protein [Saprospiraceae bacterium]
MKHLIIVLISLSASTLAFGQYDFTKNIYVEGFGPGLAWSINYDMRFAPDTKEGLGGSIGFGTLGPSFSTEGARVDLRITTIPVQVNYLFGKGTAALELGAGVSPIFISYDGMGEFDFLGETYEIPQNGRTANAYGFLNIGMRLQPKDTGLLFKINYTPLITGIGVLPVWGGISLGYQF